MAYFLTDLIFINNVKTKHNRQFLEEKEYKKKILYLFISTQRAIYMH